MLYNFELEGDPDPNRVEVVVETGYCIGDVVLSLYAHLPQFIKRKLYFDSYFTYLELLLRLKDQDFCALGTLRLELMRGYC